MNQTPAERTRRYTFIVLPMILAVLFIALADQAERHSWSPVDVAAQSLLQSARRPALEAPVRLLSDLGSAYVLIPLNLAILLALWRRHRGLALLEDRPRHVAVGVELNRPGGAGVADRLAAAQELEAPPQAPPPRSRRASRSGR